MAHLMYSPPSDSHAGAECCPGRRIDNNLFITIQYLTMKMLPCPYLVRGYRSYHFQSIYDNLWVLFELIT